MGGDRRRAARCPPPTRAETEGGEEEEEEEKSSLLSILAQLIRKMLLCCCWPISKCVKVLSCFDTFVVGWFAYSSFSTFMDTLNNLHWTTVVSTLFFCFFLVCQLLGTVFIILAARRNVARYCLPRLVLIAGLAICSLMVVIFMIIYFAGSSQKINQFIFKAFEYFFNETLSDVDRVEMKHQLRYYGAAFFVLALTFFTYNIFEFWLTFKFKSTLNDFEAVPTEATAPQMSHNPEYSAPPKKVFYPNMA